jgi:hypothetical protein
MKVIQTKKAMREKKNRNMLGLAIGLIAGFQMVIASSVSADSTTYATVKRQIKVGILLIDSTTANPATGPENPDPFVFYIANERTDVKPQSWELVNPMAPATVTADIYNRWSPRVGGSDDFRQLQIGERVTKNMGPYWEVSLSKTSAQDLAQFDLLYIHTHNRLAFTPADREKIRKFVDTGGAIWVEDCGGARMSKSRPFFLEDVQFSRGATGSTPYPYVYVPTHPLLTTPNALSFQDVAAIGESYTRGAAIVTQGAGGTGNADFTTETNFMPSPGTLVNVVGNQARPASGGGFLPYIAAGRYGSGSVILTAGDTGCEINDSVGGLVPGFGRNAGIFSGKNFLAADTVDLKFLYNMIAWGNNNNAYRRNNRRTAASIDNVGSSLVSSFDFGISRPIDVVATTTAPLIIRDTLYVTGSPVGGGTAMLHAYAARPSLINGDLGRPDLGLGASYDEIWNIALTSALSSSPVFASVVHGASPDDHLYVVTGAGTLEVFEANPLTPFGVPSPVGSFVGANGPEGSGTYAPELPAPPAPVIFENKAFVLEPNGLVRCVDARTPAGGTLWKSFDTPPTDRTVKAAGAPTMGFVQQVASIGRDQGNSLASRSNGTTNDLMLYTPVIETPMTGNPAYKLLSIFVGSRNEVLRQGQESGNDRTFALRIAQDVSGTRNLAYVANLTSSTGPVFGNPISPFVVPKVRVYVNSTTNTAQENYALGLTVEQTNTGSDLVVSNFVNTGVITITGTNADERNSAILAVDYDVIYISGGTTPPGFNGNAARGSALDVANPVAILETAALGVNDLLWAATVTKKTDSTGADYRNLTSLVAASEQSREQSSTSTIRESFKIIETDPMPLVPGSAPILSLEVTSQALGTKHTIVEVPTFKNNTTFTGGTLEQLKGTVVGGYEGLTAVNPIGAPIVANNGITYVLFDAVSATANPLLYPDGHVTILAAFKEDQPIVLNIPPFDPNQSVRLYQASLDNVKTDGTSDGGQVSAAITVGNAGSSSGNTGDAAQGRITLTNMRGQDGLLSSSQQFLVEYTPQGGTARQVTIVKPETPLQWYYILPGKPLGAPTYSSDLLYLTVLNGVKASVVALDANPAANDPSVQPGSQANTVAELRHLPALPTDPDRPINHVRWSEELVTAGPTPTAANRASAAVGANGVLAINTNVGTFGFQTATTVIADTNRLIEVGANSDTIWALNSADEIKVVGGALPYYDNLGNNLGGNGRYTRKATTLSRPNALKRLPNGDYLMADTGNNRALKVDRSGRIGWQVERVNDPLKRLREADPKSLNQPTDVQYNRYPSDFNSDGNVDGYEEHYLIADAGNSRLIEVVDYYDNNRRLRTMGDVKAAASTLYPGFVPNPNVPDSDPAEDVVVWTSQTLGVESRKLRFQSVQRILTTVGTKYGYPTLVAVAGGSAPTGVGATVGNDFTGGAMVELNYQPIMTFFPLYDTTSGAPAGFYTPTNSNGDGRILKTIDTLDAIQVPSGTAGSIVLQDGTSVLERRTKITQPTFLQQINVADAASFGIPRSAYLLCDAQGAYRMESKRKSDGVTIINVITWRFTQEDYWTLMAQERLNLKIDLNKDNVINAADLDLGLIRQNMPLFSPNSLQRLPNGDYLITNAAQSKSGYFVGGKFNGEVFQVRQANDGTFKCMFSAPNLIMGSYNPMFPNRDALNEQRMGKDENITSLLEQPLVGIRL